jgi:hypothetical protein
MLRIPDLLERLIAEGRWPRSNVVQKQDSQPLVGTDRVKELAPEERAIYLHAPPFRPLSGRTRDGKWDFYSDPMSAFWEIDLDLAFEIGDFGIGSDAPILLDYRENLEEPRVIRLRWSDDCPPINNHWVVAAPDFATFVRVLGL